ncbi:MAG: pyridoxamine 5'-phosphate oxidase [Candidatus Bathyarchaeum sp.]|nr:MAG: pyridoxamine 5'-phosphate oxidase [Candidatus Bathyarchaeum sp.]
MFVLSFVFVVCSFKLILSCCHKIQVYCTHMFCWGVVLPVFKLPKMTKEEMWKLIRRQRLCRIAFKGTDYPYMAPFQYVVLDDVLYFHFTDYGTKMKLLENDKRVCVEIEEYREDLSEYSFIVLRGTLNVVTDPKERATAIHKLSTEGEQKLSTNFLPAHGFKKTDSWDQLTPTNPSLVAVKLEKVTQEIGLKSP